MYGVVMKELWVGASSPLRPLSLEAAREATAAGQGKRRVPHVLLQRRAGTGWADGWLTLPSGHVEQHEHAVEALRRELLEEVAVECTAEDLQFMLVNHRCSSPKREYVDFFFGLQYWTGEAAIMEEDKCSELLFQPVHYEDATGAFPSHDSDPSISHPVPGVKEGQLVPGSLHERGAAGKRLALAADVIPHVRDALHVCVPRMLGEANTATLLDYYPRE